MYFIKINPVFNQELTDVLGDRNNEIVGFFSLHFFGELIF